MSAAARAILRPQVPDDLHEIVVHLDQRSPAAADRFVDAAFAGFERVREMPGIGSPKSFRRPTLVGVRSWAVPGFPNHLIYYQTKDDAIVVLAVLHGARNVRMVLKMVLKDRIP